MAKTHPNKPGDHKAKSTPNDPKVSNPQKITTATTGGESSSSSSLLWVGVIIIIIGIVWMQLSSQTSVNIIDSSAITLLKKNFQPTSIGDHFRNDDEFNRIYNDIRTIEKEEWSPDKPVTEHLLHSTTPRVIRNSFITKWDAFSQDPQKRWDLYSDIWRQRISPQITGVYVGKTPYFGPLFRTNRPLLRAFPDKIQWENPFQPETRSAEELFTKIIQSKDRQISLQSDAFYYYTGGLNSPQLSHDVEPWKELIPRENEILVNVWVGEKGCVTHLHLDSYENFFVQVQGRKKFLLIPPSQSDMCYLYPYQHPSHGQSQIYIVNPPASEQSKYVPFSQGNDNDNDSSNTTSPTKSLFPLATNITVYEVELEPGDLLYLPPNWLHQVYTLEPSISVNFWSTSDAQLHYNKAIDIISKNLIHHWTLPQKRYAALTLIRALLIHPQIRRGMKVWDDERDQDPYGIIEKLQKRYGDRLLNQDGSINHELIELVELDHTPYKNEGQSILTGEAFEDRYTEAYFQRYLLPRYEPGFINHSYPRFNSSFIDPDDSTLPQYQKDLIEYCDMDPVLIMDGFTVDEYIDQYQGAGMLFTHPFIQTHQQGDIPDEVYYKSLIVLAIDAATHLSKIIPSNRPIYLSNIIESLALWASTPKGESIPQNIYCFGTMPVF